MSERAADPHLALRTEGRRHGRTWTHILGRVADRVRAVLLGFGAADQGVVMRGSDRWVRAGDVPIDAPVRLVASIAAIDREGR